MSPLSCNSQNRMFRPHLKTSLPQFAVRKKGPSGTFLVCGGQIQFNAITTTLSYTFRGFQQQLFKITRMIKVQVMQNIIMFLNYSSSKIAKNRIFNQSSLSTGLKTLCFCFSFCAANYYFWKLIGTVLGTFESDSIHLKLAIMLKNFYYEWKSLNNSRSWNKSTLILVFIDHNSVFAFYI